MNIDYGKLNTMTKQEKRDIILRYRSLVFDTLPCPECGDTNLEWNAACPSYFSNGQWWSCMNCGNAHEVYCSECDWRYQDTYNRDPDKFGIPPDYIETVFLAWHLIECAHNDDLWQYDDDGHHWEKPYTRKVWKRGNVSQVYFVQDGEPDPHMEPEYDI